MLRGHPAG